MVTLRLPPIYLPFREKGNLRNNPFRIPAVTAVQLTSQTQPKQHDIIHIKIGRYAFQSQLEERDRLVRVLQQQMLRMAGGAEPRADDTCSVATQTDRVSYGIMTAKQLFRNSFLVSKSLECCKFISG